VKIFDDVNNDFKTRYLIVCFQEAFVIDPWPFAAQNLRHSNFFGNGQFGGTSKKLFKAG